VSDRLLWIVFPPDTFFTIPDLVKSLLSTKKKVGAYYVQDFWIGIETLEHFDEALKELNKIRPEVFAEKVS
jgi:NDP-sugar pyrophosphorylase family protein